MKSITDIQLDDDKAERVRRSHSEAIREIQLLEILGAKVIHDVTLADGAEVEVAHGLGRRFVFWTHTPPRGGGGIGRVNDIRGRHASGAPIDAGKAVCLQAVGFGASVLVDVVVF